MRDLLSAETGLPISPPADPFEAQAARDGLVEASGALKVVAVSLTKIANDLRLMGSGPRAGLAEIFLPELQKGSSIMPGKVNPVIPEVVTQVAAQVIGNDQAITVGGMERAVRAQRLRPADRPQPAGVDHAAPRRASLLAEKCVDGIEANREQRERYAELTLSAATALNPYIGYDQRREIGRRQRRRAARYATRRERRESTSRPSTRRSTTAAWPGRTTGAGTRKPRQRRTCHNPKKALHSLLFLVTLERRAATRADHSTGEEAVSRAAMALAVAALALVVPTTALGRSCPAGT